MRTPIRTAGVLLAALAFAAAAEAATQRKTLDHTYPMRPGGKLVLENVNGNVKIEPWDRDEVLVRAEKVVKTGSDADAKRVLDLIKIMVDSKPDRLRIETQLPKRENGLLAWLSGRHLDMKVEYRIQVPRELDLDIDNVNGGVSVTGVHGGLELETINGGIDLTDAAGTLRLETVNGGIDVVGSSGSLSASSVNGAINAELTEVGDAADMSFSTVNGGIDLRLPRSARASIEASTTNGSIETDLPIQVEGKRTRRRLEGDLNGGGRKIELSTTNGGIDITEG